MTKRNIAISILFLAALAAVLGIWHYAARLNTAGQSLTEKADQGTGQADEIKKNNQEAIIKAAVERKILRPIDEADHVSGNKTAPVEMIIYSDFECPFCAHFAKTAGQIRQSYPEKVKIVFRHFPLTMHPEAVPAALASECAAEQGKFWEMHDRLFAANEADALGAEKYKEEAAGLGLDAAKFNQCFDAEKYLKKVEREMLEGRNLGISGTPYSFLNGQPIPGALPFDDFTAADGKTTDGLKSRIEKFLK
jgi:protein-disulfide isomerase